MPTLMLHAVIALLRLLHGGRLTISFREIVQEIAYVRAQMRWLQMCTFESAQPGHTVPSSHPPTVPDRSDEEERAGAAF